MASKKKSIADLAASIEAAESKPVMYGPKKKRGRPKGKKASKKASTSAQPAGKKRGRPKGSRNSKASSAVQVVSSSAGGRGRPKGGGGSFMRDLAGAVKIVKRAREMLADAGCEIRNNF